MHTNFHHPSSLYHSCNIIAKYFAQDIFSKLETPANTYDSITLQKESNINVISQLMGHNNYTKAIHNCEHLTHRENSVYFRGREFEARQSTLYNITPKLQVVFIVAFLSCSREEICLILIPHGTDKQICPDYSGQILACHIYSITPTSLKYFSAPG